MALFIETVVKLNSLPLSRRRKLAALSAGRRLNGSIFRPSSSPAVKNDNLAFTSAVLRNHRLALRNHLLARVSIKVSIWYVYCYHVP